MLDHQRDDLPSAIDVHARMHLLNVLALTVSAARQPAVEAVVQLQSAVGGAGVTVVPGRSERLDRLLAPVAIGVAAHLDDFDDTHLATVIHPSAAALATVLPVGIMAGSSGRDVLHAFAWGCEVQLRVGLAMSPSHYDAGWHITGTAGVIGCAVAAGLLLGLDETALGWAVGLAASSAVGHRQAFGTMTKPLHPGKAASNGVLAALLARDGFTGPDTVLEAPRGYFEVLSTHTELSTVLDGIGESWHFSDNAVKPYPCGIVAHPLIDAGLELRRLGVEPKRVVGLRVCCNPLVPDLMGHRDPIDGLQARFSAVHGIASALLDGEVGLPSYETERVRSDDAIAMRALVELVPTTTCARDAAMVRAELDDGSTVIADVAHARGSIARPLSAQEVRAKAEALLAPVLGRAWLAVPEAVDGLPRAQDLEQLCLATTLSEDGR
ncbi:MmgE/PrpD family protein [Nostocoides sp. HKS02]|uniref:MmgE/PrpD family protein n=1 Tax=Nostocoides sp. HKS02 TaxID=1813880 RepID=UPI0018A82381|nr:MmgE/PrpD family protein [Tetrasphaera sp. HKS02]